MAKSPPCLDESQFRSLLDGTLPDEEQTTLGAHLEACAACRERLDAMSGGGDTIAQMLPVDPESDHTSGALAGAIQRLKDGSGVPASSAGSSVRPSWLHFLSPSADPRHLGRLGEYEILEVIGRGGMGVVMKARDPKLERLVAVKTLNPELASSGPARARFLREARSAAAVTHEHVVTIHAVNDTGAVPFLVMEYIVGVSLEDRIQRSGQLRLEEVLRIGMQIASGLAAAHGQGLVHRDIKPSNILLENGVERVKITDFGLARVVHEAQMTQSNVVAGTPQFMSPEQASGKPVDPRSDLFSLGCVLYAMCTGRSPFRAETPSGVIHRVIEDTPRPIQEVNPDVPDWLVTIIDRLLEKVPEHRIQTAAEVAEMLGKYLAHVQQPSRVQFPAPAVRPVRSRSRSLGSRPRQVVAVAAVACFSFLLLGLLEVSGITDLWRSSELPPSRIVKTPPVHYSFVDIQPWANRDLAESPANLGLEFSPGPGSPQNNFRDLSPGTLRAHQVPFQLGPRRIQLSGERCPGQLESVRGIKVNQKAAKLHFLHGCVDAVPQHGATVATYTVHYEDGSIALFPVVSGRHLRDWWRSGVYPEKATRAEVAWSGTSSQMDNADGRIQVFHCTWMNPHPNKTIAAIDFQRGPFPYPAPFCMAITCDRDSTPLPPEPGLFSVNTGLFASNSRYSITVDSSPSKRVRGRGKHGVLLQPGRHEIEVRDGDKLIREGGVMMTAGRRVDFTIDGPQVLFPLPTAQPIPVHELLAQSWGIWCLALSRDGKSLATGAGDGTVVVWKLDGGRWVEHTKLLAHGHRVRSIAFAQAGQLLASAGQDGSIKLWSVTDGRQVAELKRDSIVVSTVAFSPDGRVLASGNDDGTVDVWNVKTHERVHSVDCCQNAVLDLAFSPDGRLLVTGGEDGAVKLWNVDSWKPKRVLKGHSSQINAVTFSPDGRMVASAASDASVRAWNVESGELLGVFTHPQALFTLAFSPDGKQLAAAGEFHTVRIWDPASGTVLHDFHAHWSDVSSLLFAHDGKSLITAGKDNSTRMWSLEDLPGPFAIAAGGPRPQAVFNVHEDWSTDVAFSDEMISATGLVPLDVQVWRLKEFSRQWVFSAAETTPNQTLPSSICFRPATNALITCVSRHGNPRISVWNVDGHMRQSVFEPSSVAGSNGLSLSRMAMVADGTAVVVATWRQRAITMIDLQTGKTLWTASLSHDQPTVPAISPDGQIVAVGTGRGVIVLLNAKTGEPAHQPLRHGPASVEAVAYSSEGVLVSADVEGVVKLWDSTSFESRTMPQAHHERVSSTAFSPDGHLLVTAGGCTISDAEPWAHKGEVCLWNVQLRKLLAKFNAHCGCVTRAVFSPSGELLATTGRDGKMRLWDVAEILTYGDQSHPQ